MSARPTPSLLDFAIASTLAVVPILLAVLLAVASARGGDEGARADERHVSVRHVAALKTFERAIVRRDAVASPLPTAVDLAARLPACREAFGGDRVARELAAIDAALVRFGGAENRRVAIPVGLDGARWMRAVDDALRAPVDAPDGRVFRVRCEDVALAVRALARAGSRMLDTLAWRGSETERTVARWRADQVVEVSPRQVARANPWAGLPGCVYLHADGAGSRSYVAGARGLDESTCAPATRLAGEPAADLAPHDERWRVPPSLAAMLAPLEPLRRPVGAVYQAASKAHPSRLAIGAGEIDVGYAIELAIDPDVQALAQRTAACYTGRDDVCRAMGIERRDDAGAPLGGALLEHAMVRMAAIAVVDVDSGRIEALAGAMSPCTRQEHDGPGRAASCDKRLPYPIRYRPDALLNPAVFHDAMPASTIKPIMAAAFLSDRAVGARWLAAEQAEAARAPVAVPSEASLRGQLARSDSARFLDRMFCADRDFAPCARPWAIQATASAIGWNDGCAAPSEACGRRDLLFGAGSDARADGGTRTLALEIPYGRLLAEPDAASSGAFRLTPALALDAAKIKRCAAGPDGRRPDRDDWEKCGGGRVVDIVAEGWGQGHARASALGGAGMMARLAAAANGRDAAPLPHLVEAVRGSRDAVMSAADVAPERVGIARDAARTILSGLSFGHRAGTSRRACEQVLAADFCLRMDWIAGKTGTPTFPNDDRSLDELARLCAPGVAKTKAERAACGPLRPYKWYVAAYRSDPSSPRWTKAIGVLAERNWLADTGRVHGAGDHGPNPAAEIAIQIAGRHAGVIGWELR